LIDSHSKIGKLKQSINVKYKFFCTVIYLISVILELTN